MKHSPRALFLLQLTVALVLTSVFAIVVRHWTSLDQDWLINCVDNFIHPNRALWNIIGGLSLVLLITSLGKSLWYLLSAIAHSFLLSQTIGRTKINLKAGLKKTLLEANLPLAKINLIETDKPNLYCFGLINPQIVISTKVVDSLQPDELIVAIKHEEHHRRQRHPLKLLLSEAIAQLLWFIPATTALTTYLRYRCEISSDAFAARGDGAGPLRRALTKLMDLQQPAWQTSFTGSPAQARVLALTKGKVEDFRLTLLTSFQSAAVLIFTAVLISLCTPVANASVFSNSGEVMTAHPNHCAQTGLFSPVDK